MGNGRRKNDYIIINICETFQIFIEYYTIFKGVQHTRKQRPSRCRQQCAGIQFINKTAKFLSLMCLEQVNADTHVTGTIFFLFFEICILVLNLSKLNCTFKGEWIVSTQLFVMKYVLLQTKIESKYVFLILFVNPISGHIYWWR